MNFFKLNKNEKHRNTEKTKEHWRRSILGNIFKKPENRK